MQWLPANICAIVWRTLAASGEPVRLKNRPDLLVGRSALALGRHHRHEQTNCGNIDLIDRTDLGYQYCTDHESLERSAGMVYADITFHSGWTDDAADDLLNLLGF